MMLKLCGDVQVVVIGVECNSEAFLFEKKMLLPSNLNDRMCSHGERIKKVPNETLGLRNKSSFSSMHNTQPLEL